MRSYVPCRLVLLFLLSVSVIFCQQSYVGRFELYSGLAYFNSPDISLQQRGYHLQAGINPKVWYSLGFDYSIVSGNTSLQPSQLKPGLQQQIGGQLAALVSAGLLSPTYRLSLPIGSTTTTYAAGPQLTFRHFEHVTIFVRPSIGAIHETARPHAYDAVSTAVIAQLAPSGKKTDWKAFYGFGGGADLNVSRYLGLRLQADFVHNSLFTDVLKDSRNTVRLSIGPTLHYGKNIVGR